MIHIESLETATALRAAFEPLWIEEQGSSAYAVLPGMTHTVARPDPAGMCVVTSETLRVLDPSWRCVYGQVRCSPHTWCERDGVVLDLTGDQFPGVPPVVFGARPAGYDAACWCGDDHSPEAVAIMAEREHRQAQEWAQRVLVGLRCASILAASPVPMGTVREESTWSSR